MQLSRCSRSCLQGSFSRRQLGASADSDADSGQRGQVVGAAELGGGRGSRHGDLWWGGSGSLSPLR